MVSAHLMSDAINRTHNSTRSKYQYWDSVITMAEKVKLFQAFKSEKITTAGEDYNNDAMDDMVQLLNVDKKALCVCVCLKSACILNTLNPFREVLHVL